MRALHISLYDVVAMGESLSDDIERTTVPKLGLAQPNGKSHSMFNDPPARGFFAILLWAEVTCTDLRALWLCVSFWVGVSFSRLGYNSFVTLEKRLFSLSNLAPFAEAFKGRRLEGKRKNV